VQSVQRGVVAAAMLAGDQRQPGPPAPARALPSGLLSPLLDSPASLKFRCLSLPSSPPLSYLVYRTPTHY
jgi:hypothetical protein